MKLKNEYLIDLLKRTEEKNPFEPEFIQAVTEVFSSLEPVVEKRPDFIKAGVLEMFVDLERQIIFRVPWTDDNGNVRVIR